MFDKPDEYEAPSTEDQFRVRDHVDRLVAISVEKHEPSVTTSRGPKPAIGATVTLVDGPAAGRVFPDALIFGSVLVPQLRAKIGRHVLGRLYEGEARGGDNAPYKLREATEQETEYAVRFLTGAAGSVPAAQTAPPAAAAAPAPTPAPAVAGGAPKAPWET